MFSPNALEFCLDRRHFELVPALRAVDELNVGVRIRAEGVRALGSFPVAHDSLAGFDVVAHIARSPSGDLLVIILDMLPLLRLLSQPWNTSFPARGAFLYLV